MHRFSRNMARRMLLAGLCIPLAGWLQAQTSVRSVKVAGRKDAVEIEVEGSDRLLPQTRVLTEPDRLVIDFPDAVPGSQLRSQSVNLGEVKDVRFGLFQSKPPVTRLVIDLKIAQSFQVFPSGRTVIIKVVGAASDAAAGVDDFPPVSSKRPSLVAANYTSGAERVPVETPAQPPLEVSFRDGLLAIRANKATLSEVLRAVQQRTGAQVVIAPEAEQESVVVDIAPAPAAVVLGRLLYGSKFNFLIVSAPNDPRRLERVILSPRMEGGAAAMPIPPVANATAEDDDDNQPPQAPPGPPPQNNPGSQPEMRAPPEDNSPDQ